MKKFFSVFLAVLIIAALCVSAFAEPIVKPAIKEAPASDIDKQLELIFKNINLLCQETDVNELWSYTVTDLDHNGSLELIAAIQKGAEMYTYAKIWEVGKDLDSFIECDMGVGEGEPFVDIICESADTYYDKATNTWYYMFSEDYGNSSTEFYAVKCSVSLKDDYVSPAAYAMEHVMVNNGLHIVEYTDLSGNSITLEEYNAAGADQFKDFEKSGTNFGWFHATEITSVSTLTESYEIFKGGREPSKVQEGNNSIIIVPAPNPTSNPYGFLSITKHPTSEYHKAGETALFVAYAQNYTKSEWSFVSPNGENFTVPEMRNMFGTSISGEYGTTLSVSNLNEGLSGWGVFCTFYGNNQSARSSTAYLHVTSKPVPIPSPVPTYGPVPGPLPSGTMSGTVSDFSDSKVIISLSNGSTVRIYRSICSISGNLGVGASCTVYYEGWLPDSSNIYYADIQGFWLGGLKEEDPEIDPVYPVWEDDSDGIFISGVMAPANSN